MRKFFLFIIALDLILDGCGGGLDMTMKPSKGFKVKSSVEVEGSGLDAANLQLKIERALFKNGVNVTSLSVASVGSPLGGGLVSQDASQSSGKSTDSVSAGSSTIKGRGDGSGYLLEFRYKFDYAFPGVMITDFSATVFKGGEIVGMMSYHGGRTTAERLAENVGKELAQKLK